MTAAIATIVFLSAGWLAIVAMAGSFQHQFEKVVAALRGEVRPSPAAVQLRLKARYQPLRQPRVRIRPQLRAAA